MDKQQEAAAKIINAVNDAIVECLVRTGHVPRAPEDIPADISLRLGRTVRHAREAAKGHPTNPDNWRAPPHGGAMAYPDDIDPAV
jgi:hypothetical protein